MCVYNASVFEGWIYFVYSTQYKGAAIPTLQEGLAAAKELNMLVFLDIKDAEVGRFARASECAISNGVQTIYLSCVLE